MSDVKKLITLSVCFLLFMNVHAQQDHATDKKVIVYVTNMDEARMKLQQFLGRSGVTIYKTNLDMYEYEAEFRIGMGDVQALDSLANKLGYILQSSFNTENVGQKIAIYKNRIRNLQEDNEDLAKQLTDTLLYDDEGIGNIKRKIINNNYTITENQRYIRQYEEAKLEERECYVEFTLRSEMSTPTNTRISFVNMPGVEYNYLWVENPKAGLSSAAYHGVAIKYMFTRGKSYFNIGAYKNVNNNTKDSTLINEMFMINFGQDFYPKHFGRGSRKFLNLYTGYQVGGFITNRNNERNGVFVANANLSLGLELLKTRHILIDNKATYFLPLSDMNRNLRGIIYSASFNFVF